MNEPGINICNTTLDRKMEEEMDEEITMNDIERYAQKLKMGKAGYGWDSE